MFKWLTLFAGFLYIVLGIFIITSKTFINPLEPNTAYILGGLFVLYGVFRIFRAVSQLKNKDLDE